MDEATRELVRRRARRRCKYCRLHEEDDPLFTFHVEHIRARQHGGTDTPGNLALACHQDNLHKEPNLTGIDPVTGKLTRLFNPRRHKWTRHFRWDGLRLVGRTAIGRATVVVLGMNLVDRVTLREALITAGRFPPPG
ncbi:MAG: HNH endonuclease [Planctomycetes bacterium]|nr:HNH endonuclease [Planctomycetota bacterium]